MARLKQHSDLLIGFDPVSSWDEVMARMGGEHEL